MMEKRWPAIPPQSFLSDGGPNGRIEIANTKLFKVKQHIVVGATGLSSLELEVKHVESSTVLYVGPRSTNIKDRTNLSTFRLNNSAFILANEQPRSNIPEQEIQRLTYEEEPSVARRTILVDELGNRISSSNPLPISGSISVSMSAASTPTIVNMEAPLANTEYLLTIPSETKRFTLRVRTVSSYRVAYVSGGTATSFLRLSGSSIYNEESMVLQSPLTIYVSFETARPEQVIELLYWT